MTYITGGSFGYSVKGIKPGDLVVDADSGDINRAYDNGQKLSLHYVGNIHQPAAIDKARAILDGVAKELEALVPRCN